VRCLVVDDSEAFVASACRLLESQGLKVVGSASCGERATRLIEQLRPDVVLVDIELGEEDGFELTRRLAAQAPGIPVILVSTHAEEELAESIAASPAVGFLPKRALSARAIAALLC
jgi:DNA-binding NarL/FixJ family response regulator